MEMINLLYAIHCAAALSASPESIMAFPGQWTLDEVQARFRKGSTTVYLVDENAGSPIVYLARMASPTDVVGSGTVSMSYFDFTQNRAQSLESLEKNSTISILRPSYHPAPGHLPFDVRINITRAGVEEAALRAFMDLRRGKDGNAPYTMDETAEALRFMIGAVSDSKEAMRRLRWAETVGSAPVRWLAHRIIMSTWSAESTEIEQPSLRAARHRRLPNLDEIEGR